MGTDKIIHFLVCYVLCDIFSILFKGSTSIILVGLIGLMKEINDDIFYSNFDIIDFLANIIGIALWYIKQITGDKYGN